MKSKVGDESWGLGTNARPSNTVPFNMMGPFCPAIATLVSPCFFLLFRENKLKSREATGRIRVTSKISEVALRPPLVFFTMY